MNTIYKSSRPDSDFKVVEVDGEIYAVDLDTQYPGHWGKFQVTKPANFMAGTNEFVHVTPDGEVTRVYDVTAEDCVFFGDFDFDDSANSPEDLF